MGTQELLQRGNEAFVDEDYSTALDLYSQVIRWAGLKVCKSCQADMLACEVLMETRSRKRHPCLYLGSRLKGSGCRAPCCEAWTLCKPLLSVCRPSAKTQRTLPCSLHGRQRSSSWGITWMLLRMQAKPLSYGLASPRPTCGRGELHAGNASAHLDQG